MRIETDLNGAAGDGTGAKYPDLRLRTTVFRAILMVSAIALVGMFVLQRFEQGFDEGPVDFVSKEAPQYKTYLAPDRPEGYPERLPTLDNVMLVKLTPLQGAIKVQLSSPRSPREVIDMVEAAFAADGWVLDLASSDSEIIALASKEELKAGLTISPVPALGAPKGWTTVIILLEQEPSDTLYDLNARPDVPDVSPESQG